MVFGETVKKIRQVLGDVKPWLVLRWHMREAEETLDANTHRPLGFTPARYQTALEADTNLNRIFKVKKDEQGKTVREEVSILDSTLGGSGLKRLDWNSGAVYADIATLDQERKVEMLKLLMADSTTVNEAKKQMSKSKPKRGSQASTKAPESDSKRDSTSAASPGTQRRGRMPRFTDEYDPSPINEKKGKRSGRKSAKDRTPKKARKDRPSDAPKDPKVLAGDRPEGAATLQTSKTSSSGSKVTEDSGGKPEAHAAAPSDDAKPGTDDFGEVDSFFDDQSPARLRHTQSQQPCGNTSTKAAEAGAGLGQPDGDPRDSMDSNTSLFQKPRQALARTPPKL